ncbi:hypothetical protein JCM10213_004759 [Rhodosporidiobolus nylandii]
MAPAASASVRGATAAAGGGGGTGGTSQRKGRKLNRSTGGGPRSPACRSCQKRRVRCDGGDPCSACLRKAAWDGVPPPMPGACEYEGGVAPNPAGAGAGAGGSGKTHAGARKIKAKKTQEAEGEESDEEELPAKGKGKEKATGAGGGGSKPLQKGLACLACKSRRVRCDGLKPRCTACVRHAAKHQGDGVEVECVYRADLYLRKMREREEAEREREKEREADARPEQPSLPLSAELLPPLPPLPASLPPLPSLPLPIPHPTATTVQQPAQHAAAYASPAFDPTSSASASAMNLSSIFPSLPHHPHPHHPYAYSHPSSYPSPHPSAPTPVTFPFSQPSTAPPSPSAFSACTPSLLDSSLSTLDSSAASWAGRAFPSPRQPLTLEDLAALGLIARASYPPVPYPPSASDAEAAGQGQGQGQKAMINPFWTQTGAIPPLVMGELELAEVEELNLPPPPQALQMFPPPQALAHPPPPLSLSFSQPHTNAYAVPQQLPQQQQANPYGVPVGVHPGTALGLQGFPGMGVAAAEQSHFPSLPHSHPQHPHSQRTHLQPQPQQQQQQQQEGVKPGGAWGDELTLTLPLVSGFGL